MDGGIMLELTSGDIVVRGLYGGGYMSEDLIMIEYVDDQGNIFIEGADGDYTCESVYRFDRKTLKSVNNFTPGFYSVLHRKATWGDLDNLERH